MADKGLLRKLAAVLYADVAGYSRLTGADEEGTHQVLGDYLDLFAADIGKHGGRVVHYAGDAVLAEFPSVTNAISSAMAVQHTIFERNAGTPEDSRILFRIGINLGEVIVDRDDIYGDGVNIAARLETLAEPGGICISDKVKEEIQGRMEIDLADLGDQIVKNIERPVRAWRIAAGAEQKPTHAIQFDRQKIRYCTSADGTALAWSEAGEGPPLLKTTNWMSHLEHDWSGPIFGPQYSELATRYRFIRHDQRGNGLSDRNPQQISFEHFVADFEAVAAATGLERFPILGISQGAAVALRYAASHPERVSALVLQGGFARGRRCRPDYNEEIKAKVDAMTTLIRTGWGQDSPAFRQLFTDILMPAASREQVKSLNELMRMTVTPEVAEQIYEVSSSLDVSDLLGQIKAPTLIAHSRNDLISPFEEGRFLAAGIPNAELVELDSPNHLLVPEELSMERYMSEVHRFLAENPSQYVNYPFSQSIFRRP